MTFSFMDTASAEATASSTSSLVTNSVAGIYSIVNVVSGYLYGTVMSPTSPPPVSATSSDCTLSIPSVLFLYDLLHINPKFYSAFHGLPVDVELEAPSVRSSRERISPPTSQPDLSSPKSPEAIQTTLFSTMVSLSSHLFQASPELRNVASAKLMILCWVVLAEHPECIQHWCTHNTADIPLCRLVSDDHW
jgi:hypothetical protein